MAGKNKDDLTPEEREARARRARENGRKGGRPPKSPWNAVQKFAAEARAKGEAILPYGVDYLIEILKGEHEDATHDHRIRALEFLADRCGMHRRTEITGALDVGIIRTVNAVGWRDPSGQLRNDTGQPIDETGQPLTEN